jgi:hypothetical protein
MIFQNEMRMALGRVGSWEIFLPIYNNKLIS